MNVPIKHNKKSIDTYKQVNPTSVCCCLLQLHQSYISCHLNLEKNEPKTSQRSQTSVRSNNINIYKNKETNK